MNRTVYLDYAAATPLDPEILESMLPYMTEKFYNPSALYAPARQVAAELNKARMLVAQCLGVQGREIIFTAGGTEANNLAINGVMQLYPEGNIIVSAIEHESVLVPAAQYEVRLAPVLSDGRIDLPALKKLIDNKTVLVSIMYANNEIGTIQPLKQVSNLVRDENHSRAAHTRPKLPLYLHTDAAQAPNYLGLHAHRLGVDLMTINGGKIYGPKQSGALYVKSGVSLRPQILGGGQERNLRSGTEPVAQCIGLAQALHKVQSKRLAETQRLKDLQLIFMDLLTQTLIEHAINGSLKYRLPNNLHVNFPRHNNERLLIKLNQSSIYCSTGSACSASQEETSHVLKALGMGEPAIRSSLRFTFGQQTTLNDLQTTIKVLAQALNTK